MKNPIRSKPGHMSFCSSHVRYPADTDATTLWLNEPSDPPSATGHLLSYWSSSPTSVFCLWSSWCLINQLMECGAKMCHQHYFKLTSSLVAHVSSYWHQWTVTESDCEGSVSEMQGSTLSWCLRIRFLSVCQQVLIKSISPSET